MSEGNGKTSTGIQENSASILCYLGWWITGIIFYVMEKENKVVRFHAVQSIIVFGLISVVLIVLSPLGAFIPFFRWLAYLVYAFAVILWIVLIIMSALGQMVKLPWAGNLAENYSKIPPAQPNQPQSPGQQPPVQQKEEKKE